MSYEKQPGRARRGTVYHADGSRTYPNGQTYRPKRAAERKVGVNKPSDPRAVRFHTRWFVPVEMTPEWRRRMPETRPDTDAYDHMSKRGLCTCDVCLRPEDVIGRWQRKWRRERGLRP